MFTIIISMKEDPLSMGVFDILHTNWFTLLYVYIPTYLPTYTSQTNNNNNPIILHCHIIPTHPTTIGLLWKLNCMKHT